MNAKPSSGFNINLDDETPVSLFASDPSDVRLKRLSRRMVLAAVLIPCVIFAILAAAYVNLNLKFISLQSKGETGVQSLTQNLESRFSSLSVQLATLEESISQKLPDIEKNAEALKQQLKAARKEISALATGKSDRKELEEAASALRQSLTEAQQNLNVIAPEVAALEKRISSGLADIGKTVETQTKAVSGVKADIAALKSDTISSRQFASGIEDQRKTFQKQLTDISETFTGKFTVIDNRMKELQQLADSLKKDVKGLSSKTSQSAATARPAAAPANTAGATPAPIPKPGTIIEQNLP